MYKNQTDDHYRLTVILTRAQKEALDQYTARRLCDQSRLVRSMIDKLLKGEISV